jgi:hypothetical protein
MNKISYRKKSLIAVIAAAALTSNAMATLIPISAPPTNAVNLAGQGLGAVNTIMTFQGTGGATTASGTVGWNGSAVTTTGDTTAINNVWTMAQLGTTSFNNIVLLFNGNETGEDPSIRLISMSLNLYAAGGGLLPGGTFSTAGFTDYSAFPGVGSAGFAYRLDADQAMAANALLAANPLLRIGASASVSSAHDGPETISVSTLTPPTTVPDAGSTVAFLGLGLVALGFARRLLR